MGEALDAGLELAALVGCFVAIGLLAILITLLEGLDRVLNISVLGVRPFAFLAAAIRNTIIAGLNVAVQRLEAKAAQFESGLVDALALIIAAPILLAEGVYKALQYGWHAVTLPLIQQLADALDSTIARLDAQIAALAGRLAHTLAQAVAYTDAQLASAAQALTSYADAVALDAERRAERYAAQAVELLRDAEQAGVASAVRIANEAQRAGEAAAAHAETVALHAAAAAEAAGLTAATQAERAAVAAGAHALAASEAAGQSALAVVAGVAGAAEAGVIDLRKLIEAQGWAALIAAIPALALLVNTIATETGLSRAECRSKVGKVCQTDPAAWGSLLAGLAAVGAGFSLREIVDAAGTAVRDTAPLLADLAA